MASRAAGLAALFKQGQLCRLNQRQSWACTAAKGFAADVNTNAPAGESREGDYNTQEEALKEDFIATPLPEVPADVRADPKHSFPHQTDAQRRADMDVADEGEGIPKVPGYISHHDPNASPDLDPTKRPYHTASGPPSRGTRPAGVRAAHALHTSAACGAAGKHPDQQRAEDLTSSKTDGDPTAGTLGGDKAYMNPGVEDEAARDPGRLFDKDTLQEKRRAKDPEYFDRVHPGNPSQKAEQQAHEAERNQHASKREAHDATFNSDAQSNRVSGA